LLFYITDELEKWFVDLFLQTNDALLHIKGKKAQDHIRSVVEYIERNYSDFNLSANLMSEKLSFTPQYFSRIFREYTGFSFPVYVNNVKLEKAAAIMGRMLPMIKKVSLVC
jgi:AraC-type DNA-binding domain-containing proteins